MVSKRKQFYFRYSKTRDCILSFGLFLCVCFNLANYIDFHTVIEGEISAFLKLTVKVRET